MPRKDPTFSAGDIVRFYCENLTEQEQKDVQYFFYIYVPLTGGIEVLLDMISQNIGNPTAKLITALLARLWDKVIDIAPDLLSFAVPGSIRKEVQNCFSEED
jgi:hypothetical protein